MTIKDRISNGEWDIIAIVYQMGKEAAAREICDEHNKRLAAMRAAANAHPYKHLCNSIIDAGAGPQGDMIYSPHYAGDVGSTFGDDQWDPPVD